MNEKIWLKRDKNEKNVCFLFSWNCSVKNRISMNSLVFNEGEYYSKMKSARMIHVTFIYSGQVLKSFHARLHAVNCLAHCTLMPIIHSYLHNIISTWLHFAVQILCESYSMMCLFFDLVYDAEYFSPNSQKWKSTANSIATVRPAQAYPNGHSNQSNSV